MKLILSVVICTLHLVSGKTLTAKNGSEMDRNGGFMPFIVGGTLVTDKSEMPWIVRLEISPGYLCGGTLIAPDLVLTAAHCVENSQGDDVTVIAGDLDRLITEDTEQRLKGEKVIVHEDYDGENVFNDIALVKLKQSFNTSLAVKQIGLSKSFNGSHANYATVAGWGTLRENSASSRYLMKVNVPIVNDPVCSRQGVTDRHLQFCAGQYNKDSCQGDSGGPLVCDNSPENICGIVSYGFGCGREGNPGVYTHVPSYVDWIETNSNYTFNVGDEDSDPESDVTASTINSSVGDSSPGSSVTGSDHSGTSDNDESGSTVTVSTTPGHYNNTGSRSIFYSPNSLLTLTIGVIFLPSNVF